MYRNFILNGRGYGPVGEILHQVRYDPLMARPYLDENGVACCTINTGKRKWDDKKKKMVPQFENVRIKDLRDAGLTDLSVNAAVLRKDDWIEIDRTLIEARQQILRAWDDLEGFGNVRRVDAMTKTVIERETASDSGEAVVDMDVLSEGRNTEILFQTQGIPLPITHGDWFLSKRFLGMSRNSGEGLDLRKSRMYARRVMETIEQTVIGTVATTFTAGTGSPAYGTGGAGTRTARVYGYTNFSERLTKTDLTTPTGSNPDDTVTDILEMRDLMYANRFYGPYIIYHSTDWDQYLDHDYAITAGSSYGVNPTMTLRERILRIGGEDGGPQIKALRRLDFLPSSTNPFTLLMIQTDPDVARAIIGMPPTTIQWEERGGMLLKFIHMACMVPELSADYYNRSGILHATTS